MVLENKLNITDSAELARQEEIVTKQRAKEIHHFLFQDVYDFAGKMRTVNIAKGNTLFAPFVYLEVSLQNVDKLSQYEDLAVFDFQKGNP